MKTPRRIHWLTLLSTLLLALTVAAWIWTTTIDVFEVRCHLGNPLNSDDYFGIYGGHLAWRRFTHHPGQDLSWVPSFHTIKYIWLGNGYAQLPAYTTSTNGVKWNEDLRVLAIHCWLITLLTAILPLRWLIHFLRHRNDPHERLCQNCGNNLRTHPPGTNCPECGTSVPSAPLIAPSPPAHP